MSYDHGAPGRHDYLPERTVLDQAHDLENSQQYELPAIFLPKQIHPATTMPVMLNGCYETTRCVSVLPLVRQALA